MTYLLHRHPYYSDGCCQHHHKLDKQTDSCFWMYECLFPNTAKGDWPGLLTGKALQADQIVGGGAGARWSYGTDSQPHSSWETELWYTVAWPDLYNISWRSLKMTWKPCVDGYQLGGKMIGRKELHLKRKICCLHPALFPKISTLSLKADALYKERLNKVDMVIPIRSSFSIYCA